MRNDLHVGRGTTRGALTVFPVWNARMGARGYVHATAGIELAENADGPVVGKLLATNGGARPVLLVEGSMLEGGWQNRMLLDSIMVPARGRVDLPVACVEQGRWNGQHGHRFGARRATARVQAASRGGRRNVQGEVWQRVSEYDARFGADATQSLAGHLDRGERDLRELVRGIEPLVGQAGVLIGIAGQPVALEVFDDPRTFAREFEGILLAAAMDALGQPGIPTPGRRARRFLERAELVRLAALRPAGDGTTVGGRTDSADVKALAWGGRLVHLAAVNPRHELIGAAA